MADEHVLRIEFQGDDNERRPEGSDSRELTRRDDRHSSSQEIREEAQAYDERQVSYQATEDRIIGATVHANHSGPTGPEPEMEWVDETPTVSSSRALVPYDPEMAALGGGTGPTSIYGAGPTATSGMGGGAGAAAGGGAAAAAGGGGAGAGGGGAGAAGFGGLIAGGATVANVGTGAVAAGLGVMDLLGPLGVAAGVAAAGLIAFSGITLTAVDALEGMTNAVMDFIDGLLAEFEDVNPVLAAARAEQEAQLVEARMNADVGGGAQLIQQETEAEKALIAIREQLIKIFGPILQLMLAALTNLLHWAELVLTVLTAIERLILRIADYIMDLLSHLPLIGGYAKTMKEQLDKMLAVMDDNPDDHPKAKFMQEAEEFLAAMGTHVRSSSQRAEAAHVKRNRGLREGGKGDRHKVR